MAIVRTQNVSATANNVAITSTANGDLIVVFAYFAGTATIPSLPAGFTNIQSQAGTAQGFRAGYKNSTGGDTNSGTWTNATQVVCLVYSGCYNSSAAIGTAPTPQAGNGTTLTYPACTLTKTDGSSVILGFGGASSATAGMNGNPTGTGNPFTNRANQVKANGCDTAATASNTSAQTLAVTTTGRWLTITFEIKGPSLRTQSYTPTCSPTAALVKQITDAGFTATCSPSAVLTAGRLFARALTATLSFIGTFAKSFTAGTSSTFTVDFFPEINQNAQELIDSNAVNNSGIGQSFFGNGLTLDSVQFYLKKTGSPTGNANAKIYAATGAADISLSGSVEKVTGSALATSDNLDVTTLTTTFALVPLTFSGANRIALTTNTRYVVTLEYSSGSSGNSIIIAKKTFSAAPTFLGNASYRDSGHTGFDGLLSSDDICFHIYGTLSGSGGLFTNLYSHYKLEESSGSAAIDSVGGRHLLVPSGGGTIGSTTGIAGNCRSFPGTGGTYFNVNPSPADFQFLSNTFSFSFWVKINSYASADTGFVNKYINTPTSDQEFICYQAVTSHLLKLDVGNGTTVTGLSSGTTMSTATWYFVAGGWDGTNTWISVNGAAKVTTAFAGPLATGTQVFTMGLELGSASPLNGLLDEVSFWKSKTLNSTELTGLYNSGSGIPLSSYGGVTSGGTAFTQSLTATFAPTAALIKRIVDSGFTATLSFIGSTLKRITDSGFTATLSFTGLLATSKAFLKSLTATLSFTGLLSVSKAFQKILSATLSFAGAHSVKQIATRAFTATLSSTATLAKFAGKQFSATLSWSASLLRRFSRSFNAALSFVGLQVKAIRDAGFTATLSSTANLATLAVHFFSRTFTATLSFIGSFSSIRLINRLFTATTSFQGLLRKSTSKLFSPQITFSTAFKRTISKRFNATLTFISFLFRGGLTIIFGGSITSGSLSSTSTSGILSTPQTSGQLTVQKTSNQP